MFDDEKTSDQRLKILVKEARENLQCEFCTEWMSKWVPELDLTKENWTLLSIRNRPVQNWFWDTESESWVGPESGSWLGADVLLRTRSETCSEKLLRLRWISTWLNFDMTEFRHWLTFDMTDFWILNFFSQAEKWRRFFDIWENSGRWKRFLN